MKHAVTPAPIKASKSTLAPVVEHLPALSICALTAMLVVSQLVPFDTSGERWNNVAALMLWMLLFVGWGLGGLCARRPTIAMDRVTALVLVLMLVPAVSALALVATESGNKRLAVNLAWQWASFGLLFLLARQWVKNLADVRLLVAMAVALAVSLSSFSFVQYIYLMPAARVEYEQNPDQVLRRSNIVAPEGTPLRRHFEDRLYSTEPTATFALTNSLAGYLGPCLVILCGIGALTLNSRERDAAWLLIPPALLIAGALALTKSRTAFLATAIGLGLTLLYATRLGRRIDGRILLAIGLIGTLAVIGGVVSGALDVEVLSEAPKSVLYRLQYWQSTAAMIRDHWQWGVGPGNFQENYKQYQLPEASENIADPHNFVLELWAIAGTPAVVALVLLVVAVGGKLRRTKNSQDPHPSPLPQGEGEETASQRPQGDKPTAPLRGHVAGLLFGVGLAYLCGFLSELMPDVVWLFTGLPLALLTLWLMRPWIERGELTLAVLLAPIATLLINLLAAGGIGFPGVASLLWLLLALAIIVRNATRGVASEKPLTRRGAVVWLGIAGATAAGYFFTVYNPVFRAQGALAESTFSLQQGHLVNAMLYADRAAAADPFSPAPWLQQAFYYQQQMLQDGDRPALRTEFDTACDEAARRDPKSHVLRMTLGAWRLQLYRALGKNGDLAAANHEFQTAAELFPNNALVHAQFAWTLHLLGREENAAAEAKAALDLDARHEHSELKLKAQKIVDFPPGPKLKQPPAPEDPQAELVMRALRK